MWSEISGVRLCQMQNSIIVQVGTLAINWALRCFVCKNEMLNFILQIAKYYLKIKAKIYINLIFYVIESRIYSFKIVSLGKIWINQSN